MKTVRWFGSRTYDWSGLSQQRTALDVARRSLAQLGPHSWDDFDWRLTSSPARCMQCLLPVICILLMEVRYFLDLLSASIFNRSNVYQATCSADICVPVNGGKQDRYVPVSAFCTACLRLSPQTTFATSLDQTCFAGPTALPVLRLVHVLPRQRALAHASAGVVVRR